MSAGCPPTRLTRWEVGAADKVALLAGWSSGLLGHDRIDHVDASLHQVRECKFYADGATTALQQRVRLHPEVTAVAVEPGGRFETMRTLAPPAGRGLEYLGGAAPGPASRPGTSPPSWPSCPGSWPGSWPPPASGPAATTWSSTPATCGWSSTSRSATRPNWTGRSATRPRSASAGPSAASRAARPGARPARSSTSVPRASPSAAAADGTMPHPMPRLDEAHERACDGT